MTRRQRELGRAIRALEARLETVAVYRTHYRLKQAVRLSAQRLKTEKSRRHVDDLLQDITQAIDRMHLARHDAMTTLLDLEALASMAPTTWGRT